MLPSSPQDHRQQVQYSTTHVFGQLGYGMHRIVPYTFGSTYVGDLQNWHYDSETRSELLVVSVWSSDRLWKDNMDTIFGLWCHNGFEIPCFEAIEEGSGRFFHIGENRGGHDGLRMSER